MSSEKTGRRVHISLVRGSSASGVLGEVMAQTSHEALRVLLDFCGTVEEDYPACAEILSGLFEKRAREVLGTAVALSRCTERDFRMGMNLLCWRLALESLSVHLDRTKKCGDL